ncbi:hypothetical protein ACMFL9_12160 (plasmid) [Sinorhizobium meliloti]
MAVSVRYYLFPEDSSPLKLSQRLVEGLTRGNDALPQYANSRQKAVGVVLDNEDGKPLKITRTYGTIWRFDADGKITGGLGEALAHAMNAIDHAEPRSGTVVSLQPKLSRKKLEDEFRWEPSNADINLIIRDIWPKTKADRLQDAKGVSRKRPPLTFDAKHALNEIASSFWKIGNQISSLKEPSLKGFVFEARLLAGQELEYRHLYEALARIGEDQLELSARKRSGKGVWYAVVEVIAQREQFTETVRVIRQQCDGRKAAVIAARRLLVENAYLFDESVSLEASVMTDLEWDRLAFPDDGDL